MDHMHTQPLRVLLVDDHKILREGLAGLLKDEPDMLVVGEAESTAQAIGLANSVPVDVAIMDVNLPDRNGMDATRYLKKHFPDMKIVGLSMHFEEDVGAAMLDAGADAYLTKGCPAADLIRTIRTTCRKK